MEDINIPEMLRAYHLNCSDTKVQAKKYYKILDALNLRLKQLFYAGYFNKGRRNGR